MKIDIQAVNFTPKQELLNVVTAKLEKLEQFYDRIVEAEVFLKAEADDQRQGKTVEIRVNVPGSTLFSNGKSDRFEVAADTATDAMRKQIIKYKEKVLNRA